MRKAIILPLAAAALLSACSLNNEDNNPIITVTAPTEALTIQAGDTLIISSQFTDDTAVKSCSANIKKVSNNTSILKVNKTPGTQIASIDTFKVIADTGAYQVMLYADDKYDNYSNKVVTVYVTP